MVCLAWISTRRLRQSNEALTAEALKTNGFAARYVARTAAGELERRFRLVEQVAASERLRQTFAEVACQSEVRRVVGPAERSEAYRRGSGALAAAVPRSARPAGAARRVRGGRRGGDAAACPRKRRPVGSSAMPTASRSFACRKAGRSARISPGGATFTAARAILDPTWRLPPGKHLTGTTLSDVFRSQATGRWTVAVSTPMFDKSSPPKWLGVVVMTVEVGRFVELRGGGQQFAVLVDNRDGQHKGTILQHPLFDKLLAKSGTPNSAPAKPDVPPTGSTTHQDLPRRRRRSSRHAASVRNITAIRWPPTRKARNTTGDGWPRWSRSASAAATPAGS